MQCGDVSNSRAGRRLAPPQAIDSYDKGGAANRPLFAKEPLMIVSRSALAFLSVFCAGLGNVWADDWPQWMGPGRDNVWKETGIVGKFPSGGPKLLWRVKISNGYSGPAVASGIAYVTDFVSDGDTQADNFKRRTLNGKERVLALDAKTGEIKWKHEYPCVYDVSYPNGPRCTPVIANGKVYTLGAVGNLICFDAKKGDVFWSKDFQKDYKIKAPLWGFAGHPLIDGDRLVCLVGGEGSVAVAFNKDSGAEIWRSLSAKEPGYSPPVILETGGKRQLLVWHPESVNGLDPVSGKVLWSVKQETVNGTSIMAPRWAGSEVYVGAWQKKGQLLKVDPDATSAKTLWKGTRDTGVYPVNSTPFIEGGHIYGVCSEGQLRCVKLSDGERLWETFEPVGGKEVGSGTAHLIKNGDKFFIASETGDLVIAKLSPKGYEELSRWHMVDPTSSAFGRKVVWSHPAFADRCIFARNDSELICASLAKE
jgi:outer membrane protein assembly factor BamB